MFDVEPIADPRAELTARHAAILRELAELGMALARRVALQAAEPEEAAGAGQVDPGLAFSRLSRAVRLTLALEKRLFEEAKVVAPPAPAQGGFKLRLSRTDKIAYAVEDLIENTDEKLDKREFESLLDDLNERLSECEAEDGFAEAPISAVVARICADLELTPDWDLWAREDWAKEEAKGGIAGSPYARPGPAVGRAASPISEAGRATGPP